MSADVQTFLRVTADDFGAVRVRCFDDAAVVGDGSVKS